MKRSKPDLIVLLVLILGLGVTVSGMTRDEGRVPMSQQQLQQSGVIISQPR